MTPTSSRAAPFRTVEPLTARAALIRWPGRETLTLGAITALSAGSTVTFGFLSVASFALVVAGLVLMALARRAPEARAGTAAWAVAAAVMASVSFVYAVRLNLQVEASLTVLLVVGVLAIVVVARDRTPWVAIAMAAGSLVAMIAVAWQWGVLDVDVFHAVQNASSALLHGQNPYLTTLLTPFALGPGAFTQVSVHFPYMPGIALLTAPAGLLGDVRVMSLVAMVVTMAFAIRLALQSPGTRNRSIRVLALCLALPMTVAMVHYALVEVYSVAALAGWLVLRRRHPRWAILALTIALTTEPTMLVALVPPLLWSRNARRETAIAAAGAACIVLPFALVTGFGAFYHDVLGAVLGFSFRYDGLTANAAWYAATGHIPPLWSGLLAGGVIAIVVLRRRPADVGDVMMAAALLSTAAFLLAKWAFINYYFIPVWLLVFAIAGRGVAFEAAPGAIALPGPLPAMMRRLRLGAAHREA